MAVINQGGVKALVSKINDANNNFSTKMKQGADNFANATKVVWESNNAVKFAGNLKSDLDNIAESYKKTVDAIYSTLTTNVSNHNKRNGGSVSVPSLSYKTPDTSGLTSGIKDKFPDGDEGIKEGKDVTTVQKEYTTAMNSISSTLNDAVSAAASSKAFGPEEIAHFKTAYNKVKTAFDNAKQEEGKALSEYLAKEQSADKKLAQQNKENLG